MILIYSLHFYILLHLMIQMISFTKINLMKILNFYLSI